MKKQVINRKIKRLLIVVLCMIMICSMSNPVQAMNKSNWYKTVLSTRNQVYCVKYWANNNRTAWINRSRFRYYKTIDINNDGTKELLLSTTKSNFIAWGDQVMLLSYQNGKVVPLGLIETATGVKLSCKGSYLCYYHRTAGSNGYDIYKFSKGKLKRILSLGDDNYTIKNGKQIMTYRKNGKKCSEKTYKKYLKKYASGKEISYQRI